MALPSVRVANMYDSRHYKMGLSAIGLAIFFTSAATLGSFYDLLSFTLFERPYPWSFYLQHSQMAKFLMVASWPDLVLLQVIRLFLAIVPWSKSPMCLQIRQNSLALCLRRLIEVVNAVGGCS